MLIVILVSPKAAFSQDTTQIKKYINSAKAHSNKLTQAIPELDTVLSLAKNQQDDKWIAKALIAKGRIYQKNNLLNEADSSYNAAKNILQKYPVNKEYIDLLKDLCICNYYLNNNQKVFEYATEGLKFSQQLDEKSFEGTFNNISGIVMDNMGNKAEAMNYYLKALNIFTEIKNQKRIASIELNMGVIYEYQKDEKNALKYYENARHIAEKIKDTATLTAAYNNIGNVYADQKEYKKALKYINKSLELSQKTNDLYTVALDLNNIGDLYKNLNDSVLEFLYYNKALKLARRIQDNGTITLSLYNLAEYYWRHNNLPGAIKSAKKSLQFAQNGGNVSDVLSAMKLLHQLYADQHNFKKAYQFLKSYSVIQDSVFSNKKARQLMVVEEKNRVRERNRELLLAQETKKRVEAYFIIYTLLTILVLGLFIMWYRIRSAKSKDLRRQKHFIDAVLEESTSHVAMLDEHLKSTYLSPSLKVFSRDVNSRVGVSILEFIHPDDIDAVKNIATTMKKGESLHQNLVFRLRKSDGEYRTMRGLIKKIEGDHPLLKGYIINFWDVTEIQKSQQALKESEEKFREIFNAFPDIYFKMTQEGILTEISPSVKKIAGYEPEELIGKPVSSFTHLSIEWDNVRKTFLKRTSIHDLNVMIFTKEQEQLHCSLNAHVIEKEGDNVAGFEGTLRDITRRVNIEKDLKRSQRKLEIANDSKDKLLSIIAHDLRGAVGTQKAILRAVADEFDALSKEEISELITTIKNSADSTYTVVENLLSWARIMRENITPRLLGNNFYPVIKNAMDVLNEQAKSKEISLVYQGSKAVPGTFDIDLMNIVFRNLISNAIKFSKPGDEVKVRVLNNSHGIEIIVEDQGIGMSQEDIRNILSNSEKLVSRPGTKSEKGTGLGLIIVREFIAMNLGKLFIESEPDQGTRFIMHFLEDTRS